MSWLFVLLLLSNITLLLSQTLLAKLQWLTPTNYNTNGVDITTNEDEVTPNRNNRWNVSIRWQTTYQFIINLDNSWGFHPNITSSIQITINSPSVATGAATDTFDDIVFGFSTNNQQYISAWIPMDNNGQKNRIYPNCDQSANPIQSHGIGNIAILPNTDRNCDVASGSCTNWNTMYPKNAQFPNVYQYNSFPITFTLENNPIDNTLILYFNTATFSHGFVQKCGFVALPTNEGLQVYIGGNDIGQSFIISSFRIESFLNTNATNPFTPTQTLNNILSSTVVENTSDNITIRDDHINKINSKIGNKFSTNENNIGVIIGVIIAFFVFAVICTFMYLKCNIDKNNNNNNDDNKDDKLEKDEIEIGVEDNKAAAAAIDVKNARRKHTLNEEGDDSEITGSNIRWHNLNALLPHETNDEIVPAYQYE